MERSKHCPLCGGGLAFVKEVTLECAPLSLGGRETVALYLCPVCGRYELYRPAEPAQDEEEQSWLRNFQEKVRAGQMAAAPFLCPTCGNLRRDRTCPICGSVVELSSLEELRPGDSERR